jgi:hypothetical protein
MGNLMKAFSSAPLFFAKAEMGSDTISAAKNSGALIQISLFLKNTRAFKKMRKLRFFEVRYNKIL